MNSEKMNLWFTTAAKAAGLQLTDKLTSHDQRSESGTAARKPGVEMAIFFQQADFDVDGKTFFKNYWRNNLMYMLVLQEVCLADLLEYYSSISWLLLILDFFKQAGFYAFNLLFKSEKWCSRELGTGWGFE
jgi:hypothetical protein